MDEERVPEPPAEDSGSFATGFFLTLGLHFLIFLFGGLLTGGAMFTLLFAIGLVQLVYVVPAIFYFRSKGKLQTVYGLLIAAAVTFLLNAACAGYFTF